MKNSDLGNMFNNQIKSKDRTQDFGEVFTKEQEINGMLDLVKEESERISSKFLEPACGHGNFLVKILERKINTIKKMNLSDINDFEKCLFIAISSIYGIDIQDDNINQCRIRIYNILEKEYKSNFNDLIDVDFLKSIKYVIHRNIFCGDTLSGVMNNQETIIFSEWNVIDNTVQRKDYSMLEMIEYYGDQVNSKLFPLSPIKIFPKISIKEVYTLD